jgi:hypothetical protein
VSAHEAFAPRILHRRAGVTVEFPLRSLVELTGADPGDPTAWTVSEILPTPAEVRRLSSQALASARRSAGKASKAHPRPPQCGVICRGTGLPCKAPGTWTADGRCRQHGRRVSFGRKP